MTADTARGRKASLPWTSRRDIKGRQAPLGEESGRSRRGPELSGACSGSGAALVRG